MTIWTEIARIRKLPAEEAKTSVVRLGERYLEAVTTEFEIRIHKLRQAGFQDSSVSNPMDLAHEFLFKHVLKREIVQKADSTRGRFRDFLWRCLGNFWADKLSEIRPAANIEDDGNVLPASNQRNPGEIFDLAVANSLAEEVMTLLERREREADRGEIFQVLKPYIPICPHGKQKSLADALHTTPPTVCKWLQRLAADFDRKFREQVCNIVWDPEDSRDVYDERDYLLKLWLDSREIVPGP